MRYSASFLFDRGGEGAPMPAPVEMPIRPSVEPSKQSIDSVRAAGAIRAALGTPGADLGQVIRDLSKRTGELGENVRQDPRSEVATQSAPLGELNPASAPFGELSAGSLSKSDAPEHPIGVSTPVTTDAMGSAEQSVASEPIAKLSLADILAAPNIDSMKSLEGRIINTPAGPMVISKTSINIGSGEVGVLAHPFGVEAAEVDSTRLSLADLRDSEVSEMSDTDYIAQSIDAGDMTAAVFAAEHVDEMVVGASKQDMVEIMKILSEKKGRRLDVVIEKAKEHQSAEDPAIRAYGMDMEIATLQLKQDQLQKRLQKHPGEKPAIEAKWNELRDEIAQLKGARVALSAQKNQLTEFTRQLGVSDELAGEAPLVGLQRLLSTQSGKKTVLTQLKLLHEQQGEEDLGVLEETVSGIVSHSERVDLAKKAGVSLGILMAIMSFIIMNMTKRTG